MSFHLNNNLQIVTAMKKARIGICDVEIYESIEELPITRWHKYQKYSLIESGIGSDLASVDAHIARAIAYFKKGEGDKASAELQNLRQAVYFVQNEENLRLLSCACLIKSVDGVPCDDLTEEGLRRVVEKITDVPTNVVAALFKAVKKKMDTEVATYFPSLYSATSKEKEFSDILLKRTIAEIHTITRGEDDAKVRELDETLLTMITPMTFQGEKNFEVEYDKQFEKMCAIISQHQGVNAKQYNVMEFFAAYEQIKEQHNGRR